MDSREWDDEGINKTTMHPRALPNLLEETARITHASFLKGYILIRMRHNLAPIHATLFAEPDFYGYLTSE